MMASQIVPNGFFVTGDERSEIERVNENLHNAIYRPTFAQIMELTDKAKRLRDGEVADGMCAAEDGDTVLAESCLRRAEEIEVVLKAWRRRWREYAAKEIADSRAEYAMESQAENAWLRHSERFDPEAQRDLEIHDMLSEER